MNIMKRITYNALLDRIPEPILTEDYETSSSGNHRTVKAAEHWVKANLTNHKDNTGWYRIEKQTNYEDRDDPTYEIIKDFGERNTMTETETTLQTEDIFREVDQYLDGRGTLFNRLTSLEQTLQDQLKAVREKLLALESRGYMEGHTDSQPNRVTIDAKGADPSPVNKVKDYLSDLEGMQMSYRKIAEHLGLQWATAKQACEQLVAAGWAAKTANGPQPRYGPKGR